MIRTYQCLINFHIKLKYKLSARMSAKILQIDTALLWAFTFCFTDFASQI